MSLLEKTCSATVTALDADAITTLLPQVPGWSVVADKLLCTFAFRNYYETIAFVNALAWMVHQQDHHPELVVSYKQCAVTFNTHSVGGALSENDFICAAKASAIYAQRAGA
ncbi:MAG: 4a-hydroxytetrahydrobiopterin dehydratase [Pseudomonadota bacterium]